MVCQGFDLFVFLFKLFVADFVDVVLVEQNFDKGRLVWEPRVRLESALELSKADVATHSDWVLFDELLEGTFVLFEFVFFLFDHVFVEFMRGWADLANEV